MNTGQLLKNSHVKAVSVKAFSHLTVTEACSWWCNNFSNLVHIQELYKTLPIFASNKTVIHTQQNFEKQIQIKARALEQEVYLIRLLFLNINPFPLAPAHQKQQNPLMQKNLNFKIPHLSSVLKEPRFSIKSYHLKT